MITRTEHRPAVGRLVPLLLSALGTALLGLQSALSFTGPNDSGGTGAVTAGLTVAVMVLALASTVAIARAATPALALSAAALTAAAALQILLGPAPPRFIALVPLAIATALLALPLAPTTRRRAPGFVLLATLALALHAAVAFPYLVSGLVAPLYGILALWAVWAAFLALIVQLLRTRPAWALVVPPVALAVWFAALSLGEALLGWSP
jgi:hypothetical protein